MVFTSTRVMRELLGSVLVSAFCIYWIGGNRLTVAAVRAGRFESGKVHKQLIRQLEARAAEGTPASSAAQVAP